MGTSDVGRTPAPTTSTTAAGVTATADAPTVTPSGTAAGPPGAPTPPAGPPRPDRRRPRRAAVAVVVAVVVALVAAAVLALLTPGDPGDGDGAGDGAPRDRPAPTADPNHSAVTLHVSPGGDDSAPGTAQAPFGTLETALTRLQPGDTLVVADGEYRESIRDLAVVPGTPDRRIRVEAAPGAQPVVRGLLWLVGADYWDVVNLDVRWDGRNQDDDHMVKFQGGTGWTLQDGELSDARSYAALLVAGGASRFTVSGMYIHDTRKANGRNQDHLIYVNTDARGGVIERNVLVGSPNGRAIKVGPPGRSDGPRGNLVIRYNTMVDNRGPSNVSLSYDVSGVEIYRNIMVDPGGDQESVTTLDLSGSGNVVRDNVVFGSAGILEPGTDGVEDGGGNRTLDPRFTDPGAGDYRPTDPQAAAYGAFATR